MSLAKLWQEVISGHRTGLSAKALRCGLRALAPLYGTAVRLNRGVYEWGVVPRRRLPCPVLSIGNITTGGTGKTSAAMLLAKVLLRRGITPAILLRGHGRRSRRPLILSDSSTAPDAVPAAGDEACMVAQMLRDAVVAVGKRRERVGRQALECTKARAIILDDGFQYFPLARDLDIVLLDALWPLGSDRILPAGTLREPPSNLRHAHAIWLTHVDVAAEAAVEAVRALAASALAAPPIETCHQPLLLRRPDGGATQQPSALRGQTLGALSGIGNPLAFELTLRRLGAARVRRLRFPDHHRYAAADVQRISGLAANVDAVVTTEKDAVRLPPEVWELQNVWILRCEMQFVRGEAEALGMVDECLQSRL